MLELKERKEKISKDKVVESLMELFKNKWSNVLLVGGAVIDIIEDRKPKDYDIIGVSDMKMKLLQESGFKFQYDSKTATTFKKGDIIVQVLKNKISDFDYTISQSRFSLNNGELVMDDLSFRTKILKPVSYNKKQAYNALSRFPHWRKKGYLLPDETYASLLNSVSNKRQSNNS